MPDNPTSSSLVAGSPDAWAEYWEQVHSRGQGAQRSWYQQVPTTSLELLAEAEVAKDGLVLDVGGGATGIARWCLERG